MNYWTCVDPGESGQTMVTIWSDADILRVYYPHWRRQMIKVGRSHLISEENCIEDWVVVNWAWPAQYYSTL